MPRPALTWDLFCRIIDNHGDLGVCWRLSRRLAALGQQVRLWVDDAAALSWMAPLGDPAVQVMPWRDPAPDESPGEVVVEAFGCNPPPAFVARMAARSVPPVWINLEYLSAEPYAERCHGLASPQQSGPGAGLMKWFFYPGFTAATGGLLREDSLGGDGAHLNAEAWLASIGITPWPGAQRISLFCYEQPALAGWLARWQAGADGPEAGEDRSEPAPPAMRPHLTQLLVTPGPAAQQVSALLGTSIGPGSLWGGGSLQVHGLPWLTQTDFDRLLASCDLNHVRGEDSLVRALWARKPFVWQLYPQADEARLPKLEAFLDLYLRGAAPDLDRALRRRFRHWNGAACAPPEPAPATDPWAVHASAWAHCLEGQQDELGDLGRRLCRFVTAKR